MSVSPEKQTSRQSKRTISDVWCSDPLMVSKLPEGPGWSYEIKLDGYRAQALCAARKAQLLSRSGKDLGQCFPAILSGLAAAFPKGSVIDGELVALDPSGKPSFSLIQNSATSGAPIVFFAFDLLQLEGMDLTRKPLSERRELLRSSLQQSEPVQLSESFQVPAEQMLAMLRSHGLEGVETEPSTTLFWQVRSG
jgi:ATP-dependent DNA ligase